MALCPPCAPPLREAVAAARKLAPQADLDTTAGSKQGGFIDDRLVAAVAADRALDGQPVPAMLFPGKALRGDLDSAAALLAIVEREMKLVVAAKSSTRHTAIFSNRTSGLARVMKKLLDEVRF